MVGDTPPASAKRPRSEACKRSGESIPIPSAKPISLRWRVPVLSSTGPPPSPGVVLGGTVCVAIGVEFLVRNDAVGLERPLPGFRQEGSLQVLVTDTCGILVKDMPLGKRLV